MSQNFNLFNLFDLWFFLLLYFLSWQCFILSVDYRGFAEVGHGAALKVRLCLQGGALFLNWRPLRTVPGTRIPVALVTEVEFF